MKAISKTQEFSLTPSNLTEAMEFAKLIAQSSMVPEKLKDKPADILVAVQMGAEIGLKPMQAIQNIAVINGRPSVWGDAMLAIVKAHPEFEDIKEWQEGSVAHCWIKRKGQTPVEKTFSIEDAKKAKLLEKQGPWMTYPLRMLQMRARGFACRDAFPDALRGIISIEEAMDILKEKEINPTSNVAEFPKNKLEKFKSQVGITKEPEPTTEPAEQDKEKQKQQPVDLSIAPPDNLIQKAQTANNFDELNEVMDLARELDADSKRTVVQECNKRRKELLSESGK